MPIHFLAWRDTMNQYGIDFPENRFYELGGVPTTNIIQMLCAEQGVTIDVPQAAEEKEQGYLKQMAHVQPVEPIVAIAREHQGKLPMAVGTGSSKPVMKQTLTHLGIYELFDHFVASEDTEKHKPEPDVFLKAAELLGVPPQRCLVYEDTDIGLEAARRAGIPSFDVRTVHTPRRMTPG
jgi:HAD superfamily hydrolase (TIGR01509 family)